MGVADYNKGFVPQKTIPVPDATNSPSSPANIMLDMANTKSTAAASTTSPIGHLPIPSILQSEVDSPDGTMQLILQMQINANNTVSYQLSAQKADGENKITIFSQTGGQGQFSISQNTWSPDNNYVFMEQYLNGQQTWLVFNASGQNFSDGQQSIDVMALFVKRLEPETILNVTGWDSDTLLHVFTQKTDGSRGPSFWFDVPSRSFTQLADY